MKDQKQEVYAGLGHLFYSIAASDGHVAPAEAEKLKALVRSEWMPLEPDLDSAGSDLAYYIEIGFDHANAGGLQPDVAFDRFSEVYHENASVFDESTRNMVVRTSKSIARAFEGKNKEELLLIEQLEEMFDQESSVR